LHSKGAEETTFASTGGEALISRGIVVGESLLGETKALVEADFSNEREGKRGEVLASG
jgi:hypothetical protein